MVSETLFTHEIRVGWADCDPASIVYTGKLSLFALEAIDAWWEYYFDGDGWYQLNIDRNLGTPFVHLEIDFKSPVTPRFRLKCAVQPMRLGQSSIEFQVRGFQDEGLCFEGRFVCVFVLADKFTKIPAPELIRNVVEPLIPAHANSNSYS
ncbi:MAG: acyl-CoA thioesterase [Amylibacter sp.]